MKLVKEAAYIADKLKVYVVKNIIDDEQKTRGDIYDAEKMIAIDCTELGVKRPIYIDYKNAYNTITDEILRRGVASKTFLEENEKKIKEGIDEAINESFENDTCNAIMYEEERLYNIGEKKGFAYGNELLIGGETFKAYKRPGKHVSKEIQPMKGDPQKFKEFLRTLTSGLPKAQIILAFELSGIVRQALNMEGIDIGELSSVLCVTGLAGCGKTAVTVGLQEMLFGGKAFFGGNITEVAMGKILKESGVSPSVFDDTSSDGECGKGKGRSLIRQIYSMSSGKARTTNTSNREAIVYSPMIQSRELAYGISRVIKSYSGLTGFEVRLLELIADTNAENNANLITKSKEHADLYNKGRGEYQGQAIVFIRYFMEKYLQEISTHYERIKQQILEIKQNDERLCELDDRVVNRDAVIVLAANIAKEAYDLDIDTEEVIKVLLESHFALQESRKNKTPSEWLINVACMYAYGQKDDERPIARNIREFDVRKNIAAIKVSQGRKHLVIPVKISEFAFDQDWEGCKKGVRPEYIPGPLSWLWERTTGLTDNKQLVRASEGNVMHRNSAGFRTALEDWRRKSILIVGNRGYTVTKSLGGVNNIPCYELDIENMLSESGVTAYVNEEMFAPIIDEKFKEEDDGVFHPNEALTPEELGI